MNIDDYLDPEKKGGLEIDMGKFFLHIIKEMEFQKQISVEALLISKAVLERQKGNVDNDEIIQQVNDLLEKVNGKSNENLPGILSNISK